MSENETEEMQDQVLELRILESATEEEIKRVARGIATGEIFCNLHIHERDANLLGMIFIPLGLGGLGGLDPEDIGMIYADMKDAGPRTINGYPIFFSAKMINRKDTATVLERSRKIVEAIKMAEEG